MVHLVYCDNTGKKGTRELDKILSGSKTMLVRGAAGHKGDEVFSPNSYPVGNRPVV